MFKIRNSCFETNSSSMDRYDDYDNSPDHTHAYQDIRIILKWADNVSDERIDEILDNIEYVEDKIFDILDSEMEDTDDFYIDDTDNGDIHIKVSVGAKPIMTSPGYKGDRYSPPESAEYKFNYTRFPTKSEDCKSIAKIKQDLLNIFHEQGWNEIIEIENIYGEELDEDDLYDNLN